MDISNISVSRRDVWNQCTYLYKCRYHLKLIPERPEPFYFVYGTLIHKIAEEFVSNRGQKTIQEVTEAVINGTIPIENDKEGKPVFAPHIPPDYMKRLPGHIKSIQKLTEQIGTDGETEYPFCYDLDPPNEKYVKGVIDRLIIRNDKCWIIDYKTTRSGRWRKKNVTNDLQLRCYARVVQKNFNIAAENIKAALYYLEGGALVAAKFSSQSLIDAEKEMLDTYNQIVKMPPENAWGNVGEHCERCDYVKNCPFYRIT